MPDVAMFGEKDYQQLLVIRRMVADLGLNMRILGCPIVRERDGMAMSSRNAYLSSDDRKIAGQFNVILQSLIGELRDGAAIKAVEESGKRALLEAGFTSVDYLAVRNAETLATLTTLDRPARVLAAATVGTTRLLDNMAV
jgi:pantoate--beta-alanine ligase